MANGSTIVAQGTPEGSGAIALIRLSGPQAVSIASKMAHFGKKGKKLVSEQSHTIHFGLAVDRDNKTIDQVLFLLMRAPQTFTGEDIVEISCHNNQFIIRAIIARALELGARVAQKGEFTRRAVENGKIDLVRAEAINELISAQTELALQKSLSQLSGSLSDWIGKIEQELVRALALCNASFEFIEEEINFAPGISGYLEAVLEQITQVQKTYGANTQIRQGIKIAIIGTVNAGKSSLFNKLLGQERAIVTPIAGTTRDTIEATIDRAGVNWTLIDTAGIRETADTIEQEGIRRSLSAARQADIIILALDGAAPVSPGLKTVYEQLEGEFGDKIIRVITKSDLMASSHAPLILSVFPKGKCIEGSSRTGAGCEQLETAITNKIKSLFASANAPFLINKRHQTILLELQTVLTNIQEMLNKPIIHYELIAYNLQDALERISQLTGKSINEAAMDKIFQDFCVGK